MTTQRTLGDDLQWIADRAPVADVPADTWARARRAQRRARSLALAGGVAVVAVAAGLSVWTATSERTPAASRDASTPTHTDHPRQPVADRVEVTCTGEGISVDRTSVAAQPAGVVLVVSSSMPKGSYLTYISDGGGQSGGDRMSADPTTWTRELAPGTLTLTCARAGDMEESAPARVRVTDPHGYWRGESLSELGCAPGAEPSWIRGLSGAGDTPERAVDEVLANFTHMDQATYTARPAEIGYVDAATQTWIATKNERPSMTVEVSRAGAGFSAWPEWTCGPL